MFEILTVCTGNICRSPLAAQLLRSRLSDLDVVVTSAGTHGLPSFPMTHEAQHLATHLGVPAEDAASHRSRLLSEQHLESPDLILAMTRGHRRAIAELAPARVKSTFTIRELERVSAVVSTDEVRAAAVAAGPSASARLRAVGALVSAYRGLAEAPRDPAADDIIDPYRQPWEIYQRSAAELLPAVDAAASLIRDAINAGGARADADADRNDTGT